jgi:hypothetical protein
VNGSREHLAFQLFKHTTCQLVLFTCLLQASEEQEVEREPALPEAFVLFCHIVEGLLRDTPQSLRLFEFLRIENKSKHAFESLAVLFSLREELGKVSLLRVGQRGVEEERPKVHD